MSNFFKIDNKVYAYRIYGDGEPLILLHGFTGSQANWMNLLPYLQTNYQVITIDLPGHGKSTTEQEITMDEFVSDLHAFLAYLEIDSFHLLGYSLGGRTALSYAVKHSGQLRSLILESASPGLATAKDRNDRQANDQKLANKISQDGLIAFVNFWEEIPLFASQKQLPEMIRTQIRKERLSQNAQGLINSLIGMGTGAQASQWAKLRNVECPVLLITGTLDDKFVKINREMKKQFKYAQLVEVKDVGHAIHVEEVEKFAKIVLEYLNNIK